MPAPKSYDNPSVKTHSILHFIAVQMFAENMSRMELARRAGVAYTSLSRYWRAEPNCSLSINDIEALLNVFGYTIKATPLIIKKTHEVNKTHEDLVKEAKAEHGENRKRPSTRKESVLGAVKICRPKRVRHPILAHSNERRQIDPATQEGHQEPKPER